jgi:DNA-binding NarL/FixJ family response regulator
MVAGARTGELAAMKILVVDDHVLIREALRSVLKELDADAAVLEAAEGGQAMRLAEEHGDLRLVLLDVNLPDRDGISLLAEMRKRYPAVSVAVMSALEDRDDVMRALDLGAVGFIPKSAPREVMLNALRLVLSGSIYIPPQILAREQGSAQPGPKQRAQRPASPADLGLTQRQVEVLALMAQGKSNKAICRILNVAEPTIKTHITAIFRALKVSSRMEALLAVNEYGWDLPRITDS